ncbi:hypothetical protein HCX49_21725 [Sphingobacterium kitahiroshimense]|uniref:hypothetical protein n=1 Tax=Sphingobacterium sp. B16(2022) TaxID=2914044 RepID=UPI00143BB0D2|nr:hypothetical protein [Sphingobacterium sp. B16(2022)]NJI75820.1 hypothetical protein [Sphingobacterium sp. B16(2022)]
MEEDIPELALFASINKNSPFLRYIEPFIGKIKFKNLIENPMFFFKEDAFTPNENVVLNNKISRTNTILSVSCWLLKDTCGSTPSGYLVNTNIANPFWDEQLNYCTLANGTHENTFFSKSEILQVMDLDRKFRDIIGPLENVYKSENGFSSSKFSLRNYATYNKMARAQQFVFLARCTSSLLQKISWYIVALEALFSTGPADISFKLRFMVAYFLGGEPADLEMTTSIINKGYDLRSKFLHGASFESKKLKKLVDRQYQEQVSVGLDTILRKSFNMIILDKDKKDIVFDDEKSNDFFKNKLHGF